MASVGALIEVTTAHRVERCCRGSNGSSAPHASMYAVASATAQKLMDMGSVWWELFVFEQAQHHTALACCAKLPRTGIPVKQREGRLCARNAVLLANAEAMTGDGNVTER